MGSNQELNKPVVPSLRKYFTIDGPMITSSPIFSYFQQMGALHNVSSMHLAAYTTNSLQNCKICRKSYSRYISRPVDKWLWTWHSKQKTTHFSLKARWMCKRQMTSLSIYNISSQRRCDELRSEKCVCFRASFFEWKIGFQKNKKARENLTYVAQSRFFIC